MAEKNKNALRINAHTPKKRAFTLIELLLVISIMALLMAVLMPVLSMAKKQVKAIMCLSNLRQWGVYFRLYTIDNDDRFSDFTQNYKHPWTTSIRDAAWYNVLRPYYGGQTELLLCPVATEHFSSDFHGTVKTAWIEPPGVNWGLGPDFKCSYGMNGFCYYIPAADGYRGYLATEFWKTPLVTGADDIPLLSDGVFGEFWPEPDDKPPLFGGEAYEDGGVIGMRRVLVDRHNGHQNMLFLDFSVRKVGIKELWTLKWRPGWNRKGKYTLAGKAAGLTGGDWPQWMRNFKDY